MLTAHCGKYGASAHTQYTAGPDPIGGSVDNKPYAARALIKIIDNSLLPNSEGFVPSLDPEVMHLTISDAGGNFAWFRFTDEENDFTTYPNAFDSVPLYFVNIAGTANGTLTNLKLAIQAAFSLTTGIYAGYYDEHLVEHEIGYTINYLGLTGSELELKQGIPGAAGNQPIKSIVSSTALIVSGFYGGIDATARVYETSVLGDSSGTRTGTIHKDDYSITSGSASNTSDAIHRAAMHKRHRNRGDKLVYGKNTSFGLEELNAYAATGVALGSQYDNEYVSHTIPRTNDQVTWIKAIAEVDQNQLEQLDPSSDTYDDIVDLFQAGEQVKYLGIDQSGTEIGS
tara:strand:- start:786 stop:1808 length:1023 start_codon:yes stop_codon:yes gene_type:complete